MYAQSFNVHISGDHPGLEKHGGHDHPNKNPSTGQGFFEPLHKPRFVVKNIATKVPIIVTLYPRS